MISAEVMNQTFCYGMEEVLTMQKSIVSTTSHFGWVMLGIGLVIGAMIGIGLYRAFYCPGFLRQKSGQLPASEDSHRRPR